MGRNKQIPDRWLDYRPMKDIIYDARIIPIKCPLPISRFQSYGMSQYQWTPADVMRNIPNLGLVIDITNKHPAYYDPNEFISFDIDYVKIPCVGHHIPQDDVYYRFCDVIQTFLRRNAMNDRVIALHCTHGVNRTGYLLCRYLIEQMRYSPQDAIHTFASSRGYSVERENYIEGLHELLPLRMS